MWPLLLRVLLAFGAGILAGLAARAADRGLVDGLLHLQLATYRALLTATVSGLITVVAFALWMRSVMTGMMAGKVAPRLLSSHLDDRFQRSVLASMTAALGVAVGVLVSLPPQDPASVGISLPLVLVITVVAIAGILVSLNRAVTDVSVPNLVYSQAQHGMALLDARDAQQRDRAVRDVDVATRQQIDDVRSPAMGWITSIDRTGLLRALPAGEDLVLRVRSGQLVDEGDVIASVSCRLDADRGASLRRSVRLGRDTGGHNAIDQVVADLVDMACHALEPGSDDTSTGEEAMHAVTLLMRRLVRTGEPVRQTSEDGRSLLDVAIPGVRETVRGGIERLRITTATHPRSAFQLVHAIGDVTDAARAAGRDDVVDDLQQQARRLVETADRSELSAADVSELRGLADRRGLLDRSG